MQKITESSFSQFGSIYFHPIASERYDLVCKSLATESSNADELFRFPCDVYIEPTYGIGSVVIGKSPNADELYIYPIHHCLIIKPNIYFRVISKSGIFKFSVLTHEDIKPSKIPLEPAYKSESISMPFNINKVFDCSYLKHETSCNFYKPPHNHYEILYVCSGYMRISEASSVSHTLNTHDFILLSPNDTYGRNLSLNASCSYLSIVLDINIKSNIHIFDMVFPCSVEVQAVLWKIIQEASSNSIHSKMLLLCHLEECITEIIYNEYEVNGGFKQPETSQKLQSNQLKRILSYMDAMVSEPVTIEDICHEFFMSRSSLQALFKNNLGCSPKNYLINIKLQKSKELLRQNQYTISQISYLLGFSSIHYFSRLFKKYFNVSPSEYSQGKDEKND